MGQLKLLGALKVRPRVLREQGPTESRFLWSIAKMVLSFGTKLAIAGLLALAVLWVLMRLAEWYQAY